MYILYVGCIFASIIGTAFYLKGKDDLAKQKILNFVAYAIVVVYIADFFIQPLYRDGEMDVDKLPFHICTMLCPVIAFTQFNKRFSCIKEPVAILSIISPLMYIIYPGTALGTESPFCYRIMQTFLYHGLLLGYGVLMLTTKTVVPKIRNCYKCLIGICLTAVWATFGNLAYSEGGWGNGFDWFFLTGSTFPFIPSWLMPFVVIACTFAAAMVVYAVYYAVVHFKNKHSANGVAV